MCANFSIPGVTPEHVRLYLFPYTLKDEAKRWAYSLEPNEITSWGQLVERFMKKFFPPTVNAKRWKDVLNFEQKENKTLSTAWPESAIADASAAEGFMDKTYTEAKVILDRISQNMNDWIDDRYGRRGSNQRKNETVIVLAETVTALAAQMATITSILQNMAMNQGVIPPQSAQLVVQAQVAVIGCVNCGGVHGADCCPLYLQQVCAIQGNSFSNTYNPGWRSHPNFGWGGNPNQGGPMYHKSGNRGNFNQYQGQSRIQNQQPSKSTSNTSGESLESLLKQYMDKNDAVMQAQVSSIRNLEIQVHQLASEHRNRAPGTLPSNSEDPGSNGKE
ncbi:uncharacterized protein LOC120089063 [Benincasa hispida]|uniref:uncharacterized protein LOC120089063 n=1 Tax=Benincasa hispida TaxID=102211 RepID=UPI0018FF4BAB|nr:uncharacterized protein LOC120089063 [Benincasa hispida]